MRTKAKAESAALHAGLRKEQMKVESLERALQQKVRRPPALLAARRAAVALRFRFAALSIPSVLEVSFGILARGPRGTWVMHRGAFAGTGVGAAAPSRAGSVADGPGRYPPSVPPQGSSRSAFLPEPGDRGADQDLRRADSQAGKDGLSLAAPRPALCTWPLFSSRRAPCLIAPEPPSREAHASSCLLRSAAGPHAVPAQRRSPHCPRLCSPEGSGAAFPAPGWARVCPPPGSAASGCHAGCLHGCHLLAGR